MITIGLFGTCGQSTWRKSFIEAYGAHSISFYNPQLGEGEWKPEFADKYVQEENRNLKTNDIVLFPVTDETTAFGSLGEIGFSILDTMRNLGDRYLIVYIADNCNDPKATQSEIDNSERMRKLVKTKAIDESKQNSKVFVVNDLEAMLELSLALNGILNSITDVRKRYVG